MQKKRTTAIIINLYTHSISFRTHFINTRSHSLSPRIMPPNTQFSTFNPYKTAFNTRFLPADICKTTLKWKKGDGGFVASIFWIGKWCFQ